MSESIKFTCSCCGKEQESWPALTFISPDPYHGLSVEERETIAEKDPDFCIIRYSDQTDYFIRCTLTQKVNDNCQDLDYGVWISLSEKSFNNYKENYRNPSHEATYFGWLSNDIWGYQFNDSIAMDVVTQPDGNRPEAIPHQDCEHLFVVDYYKGIAKEEAEARIRYILGDDEDGLK